nr:MAG TPA: hypothetical protein [Caudoviricetes sp.]
MVGGSDCRMLVCLMMPCFFRTRGIHIKNRPTSR